MIPSVLILVVALSASSFAFCSHVIFDKIKRSQPIALPREDASPMARAERLVMEYRREQENKRQPKDGAALLRMRQIALYMDVVAFLLSVVWLTWTVMHRSGAGNTQAVKLVLEASLSCR